jgi:hypothetical protein
MLRISSSLYREILYEWPFCPVSAQLKIMDSAARFVDESDFAFQNHAAGSNFIINYSELFSPYHS